MPKSDTYHRHFVAALKRDGWSITKDPYYLKVDGIGFYIDVAAEKIVDRLTEEKQKIAAEVKNFIGLSEVNELEKAIGQYLLYRSVLQREDKSCKLYLAIPAKFYQRIQEVRIYREALNASNIKIVIYNVAQEMIVRWIE